MFWLCCGTHIYQCYVIITHSRKRLIIRAPGSLTNLQSVIVFSTYLSLLTLPSLNAQPIRMENKLERWMNPCDRPELIQPTGSPPEELDTSMMGSVSQAASTALTVAKDQFQSRLSESAVRAGLVPEEIFRTTFFDWIPQLPKLDTEKEKSQHREYLKQNGYEGLTNMFVYLQKIAIGLETIVADYAESPEPLKSDSKQLYGIVLNVLCELQDGGLFQNKIATDSLFVQRSYVPDTHRNLMNDMTERTRRDWVIIRDLIKIMEYVHEYSDFLSKNGPIKSAI
ncbi:uncharacterized protein LOC115875323 isoform X2 [Sitophilus oryzae]|uniref:Uncharacterized protein LOC115875323 isoform X2 n=1 Tax=Sitophilus oryzae TaxID=7048 RepID=A0A6J2X6G3_SITOR|nr:uncharacterized protein LOC115875323 isoform X2 [Sitophilus oryzae]